jgi:hypothetical protein
MSKIDLFQLPKQKKITLQIPSIEITKSGIVNVSFSDYPEDWFCNFKDGALAAGKEQGFVFWSEKGWEENKEKIKEAFENSTVIRNPHLDWSDFEKYAKDHFKNVRRKTERKIKRLLQQAKQLQEKLNQF